MRREERVRCQEVVRAVGHLRPPICLVFECASLESEAETGIREGMETSWASEGYMHSEAGVDAVAG